MKFEARVTGIEQINEMLAKLMPGSTLDWRQLWHDYAVYGQRTVQMTMREGARGKYPPTNWLFATIRSNVAGGRGKGKIKTISDAKNAKMMPLQDSADLKKSWSADTAIITDTTYGQVGTNIPYAEIHQTGGKNPFKWTSDMQRKFDWNVPKGEPGNWNKDYFIMRALWRRKDKRGFVNVQQRPQVPLDYPNSKDERHIQQVFAAWLKNTLGQGVD